MSGDLGCVTLVAMPRSAETFLARDSSGTLWLMPPVGAGDAERVDDSVIEEAVRQYGWDRIDAEFASWQDLDAGRRERAATLAPGRDLGVADYDEQDVRRIIAGARRRSESGDIRAARSMLHRLLRDVTLVREDVALYAEIADLLVYLDFSAAPPPRQAIASMSSRYRELAQRLDLIPA